MIRTALFILSLAVTSHALAAQEVHAPVANPAGPLVATIAEPATANESAEQTTTTKPAIESLPLGLPAPRTNDASASNTPAEQPATTILKHPVVRTVGALTLVISLILGLRSLIQTGARRGHGLTSALGAGGRAPSGVMSVLGRYPVSRGATLVLLQLDRRVLLLSQTGAGFSTLCELTDAEDVASIISKTADEEGESLAKKFSSLLRTFERDPSIAGDDDISPLSPRRAMALRDYEASLQADADAIQSPPGDGDSFTALQSRLERLRDGVA